jgi:tRNA-2-methylthio-N6-dimethylallyladenosine synthase
MSDQVSDDVKHERLERLVETTQRIAGERNADRIGRVEEILVEGSSRTDPSLLRGRTRRNTTVNFTGSSPAGSFAMVVIDDATSSTLRGREVAIVAA